MGAETLRAGALDQAYKLYNAGRNQYSASRHEEAIASLDRAVTLAVAAGAEALEVASRFWQGAALHGSGRVPEAFAVWAPALSRSGGMTLTHDRYLMLTRYVLAAVELPLPLDVLEQTLLEVEKHVADCSGGAGPRSRLLLARSRLALARGRPEECLEIGLEGLVRRKRESPCYTYSTHFRTLVRAALLARQPDAVGDFIEEWERLEHEYPNSKRFAITAARSNLALLLGRMDESVRLSETVAEEALHADDVTYALDASTAFIRACISAGMPQRARRNLVRVLRLRHCSIGEVRFDARLLAGDYHTAELECDVNEPRLDHATLALRAYAAAKREGERLDELLRSEHRGAAVAHSVGRLTALGGDEGARGPRSASI